MFLAYFNVFFVRHDGFQFTIPKVPYSDCPVPNPTPNNYKLLLSLTPTDSNPEHKPSR